MAFSLEQLPNEPILIARLKHPFSPEELRDIYAQSSQLAAQIGGRIWRITDFKETQISDTVFIELMKAVEIASSGASGSPTDPNVTVFFVSKSFNSLMFKNFMEQKRNGGVQIPIFFDVESAIEAARTQVKAQRNTA